MVAGARTDPALGRALAERWVMPRKRWGVERMHRAIAAGECVEGLDVEAALAALYSPVYAPMLLGAGVPPAPALEAILSIVFAGVFRPALPGLVGR
ncbi:TetR-like C-terminal domain-containing protein [Roseomonas sp. CCTCC AB2023176]|uniref:TetR-like C-terminal domain-containing protein n=1 Tax=Roseomonas sp. CCTCC AB2023176 TaxID=3342640 RepID=UPI0035E13C71